MLPLGVPDEVARVAVRALGAYMGIIMQACATLLWQQTADEKVTKLTLRHTLLWKFENNPV